MDQLFSLSEMLDMVKRRFRVIFSISLLGTIGAFLFAASQEHLYQSTEVLQVTRPAIDDALARPTVNGSSARRLQLIEQQLMARGTVLEIAEMFGIYDDAPELSTTERVALMREAVEIQGIAAAREGFTDDGAISVLSITATFDTPERAQGVAQEFSRRTLEISRDSRIHRARETLDFFIEEEENLLTRLDALEREETAYRLTNNLTIPGGVELRQARIASLSDELLSIERERISLQQALAQLDPSQRAVTLERAQDEINAQIRVLDQQQELLEARLAELTDAIEVTPQIERDLAAFQRRRDNIEAELELVSARRAEAEVGLKLEIQDQAERLTVIEEAALPDLPVTGSRRRIAVLGTAASVMFGLGLAFLLDLLHPVVRTARQMESRLGITPVVTIPPLEPTRRSRRNLASGRIALAGYIHEARNRAAPPRKKS